MPYNPKAAGERFEEVIHAWETLRPTKSFAGMNLAALKSQVQPSFDARPRQAQLESEMTACLLVVNAIKGDPGEGENGELYAAMGYIRKADRRSGLTRRTQANSPSPATTPRS
jgi:hypothetical protein